MYIHHFPEDSDTNTLCLDRIPKCCVGRLERTGTGPGGRLGCTFEQKLDWSKEWEVGISLHLD